MSNNVLLTEQPRKLFFHYLIPSICGTLVTSIYILADTIIIGKGIGVDAMAALNIVLPVFSLFFGIGLLFGVGGSVLMSVCRGQNDYEGGHTYFSMAALSTLFFCILTILIFHFNMESITHALGGTQVTMPYIRNYLPYVVWGMPCFAFSTFLQTFVRNDGAPRLSMIGVITGGVLNIVLDIIFVYPLHMGMMGASVASVMGCAFTCIILLTHFFTKSNGLHFQIKAATPGKWIRIFQTGFASFLIEMASGVVMFFFNRQLLAYIGDIGVSVYGIISNTAIIITCLANGVSQASQPIISTNYGAKRRDRILAVRGLALRTVIIISSAFTMLGLIVPNLFTNIFLHPTPQILGLAAIAIRLYFIAFPAVGANLYLTSYFQSTVNPRASLALSLLRGCVLSIVLVYLMPMVMGVNGIWLSLPVAEYLTLIVGVIILKKTTLLKNS